VGSVADYSAAANAFTGRDLFNGEVAFSARAVGNLARPFFPDGIDGNPNGPLSLPFPRSQAAPRTWSPFNDGVQLDLDFQRLVQPLGIPQNPPRSLPDGCADPAVFGRRIANGLQIFAGSVPLYRGGRLIGAVGISGDGIDQDDMVAFYGASRQGLNAAGHTGVGDAVLGFNAPPEVRSDTIDTFPFEHTRLRYVNCPEAPFIESNEQNVCDGL
jgi:hypothetical protein